jgi:putative ABC transport system permease protein
MARLKTNMSLDAATAALQSIQPQLRDTTMPTGPGARESYLKAPFVAGLASGSRSGGQYRQPLFIMMATAITVLLIACANIANLLLARATARRHELSVRLAMGASRWRLSRQWLVESLLLSASGALLGMFLAAWGGQSLLHEMSTPASTAFLDLRPDWRVLAFTSAVAIAVATLFGVAPAIRASKLTAIEALTSHGRGSDEGRGRFASALVVIQVALSLMLVVAAGLFVRTFTTLAAVDLGFNQGRVLVVNVNTAPTRIEPSRRLELLERIRRDAGFIHDIRAAALSVITPVSGNGLGNRVEVLGVPALPENQLDSSTNFVSPSWFATYGIPLLVGRDFTDRDRVGTPDVAIVNQAFARKFLNGANPVGRFVREVYVGRAATAPQREIVGLVADATYHSLREPAPPTVYKPIAQVDPADPLLGFVSLSVAAASGSPAALAPRVVAAITNIHPDLSLTSHALASQVEGSLARERLLALLSGFFGVLALLLAAIGLYGLTSYGVSRRRSEIGIRLALGATPNTVIVTVLRHVAVLVSAGILAGTLLSWWMARFVAPALLYGLKPRDPLTIAGAALVLLVVGALAGWLPARRAAHIDPTQVLREA